MVVGMSRVPRLLANVSRDCASRETYVVDPGKGEDRPRARRDRRPRTLRIPVLVLGLVLGLMSLSFGWRPTLGDEPEYHNTGPELKRKTSHR